MTSWRSVPVVHLRNTDLEAREVVEKALLIAGEICVYTNQNIIIEEL